MRTYDGHDWPDPPIGLVFGATDIDPAEFVVGPFASAEDASKYLDDLYERDMSAPGWESTEFRSP